MRSKFAVSTAYMVDEKRALEVEVDAMARRFVDVADSIVSWLKPTATMPCFAGWRRRGIVNRN